MTGKEVLLLLANLNGFIDAENRVEKILWSIRLTEEKNKLIYYYR